MMQKNLFSSTNIISHAPDYMEKDNGSIVCISSICGFENLGAPPGYQMAKAALNMYVASIARYLYNYKIRINAVLVNSAIAEASNPILMAKSFKNAVIAGRQCFISGRMRKKNYADASSPMNNLLTEK